MECLARPLLGGFALTLLIVASLSQAASGVASAQNEIVVRVVPPEDKVTTDDGEMLVDIVTENVRNLAGYQFRLEFDPEVVQVAEDENGLPRVEEGDFLGSSGRPVHCIGPESDEKSVVLRCVTLGPPVSFGGTPGAEGSGTLATVVMLPVDEGKSELHLAEVILVAAEMDEEGRPIVIAHETVDGVVQIGGGGGFRWVVWGSLIGVGALALIGVAGIAILRMRRRAA